jgi:hypothetical protein
MVLQTAGLIDVRMEGPKSASNDKCDQILPPVDLFIMQVPSVGKGPKFWPQNTKKLSGAGENLWPNLLQIYQKGPKLGRAFCSLVFH